MDIQYCTLCNNHLNENENEYCYECSVIIKQSIQKQKQNLLSNEHIERKKLIEQQDREFRDSLHKDRRKAVGIKRCDICMEDYLPHIDDQIICQKCQQIIDNNKKENIIPDEELPDDRVKRATMLAMQYEKLLSNKN